MQSRGQSLGVLGFAIQGRKQVLHAKVAKVGRRGQMDYTAAEFAVVIPCVWLCLFRCSLFSSSFRVGLAFAFGVRSSSDLTAGTAATAKQEQSPKRGQTRTPTTQRKHNHQRQTTHTHTRGREELRVACARRTQAGFEFADEPDQRRRGTAHASEIGR